MPATVRLSRRAFAALATLSVAGLVARPARAASMPYTPEGFQAAQAAGGPLIVEVWASWCPTCRAQSPIVEGLVSEPKFAGARVLRVDYDRQKDIVRGFGVRSQSTLIVFRGTEERGRATGITDPAQIRALLEKSL